MSDLNSVVKRLYNIRPEPIAGYKFQVFIQNTRMGFSKITNFETFIETEGIVEGGVNSHVHSLLKPVSTEKTLVFERGVGDRGLATGWLADLSPGNHFPFDILIIVGDRSGEMSAIYMVHGATVKRWQMGDLNAMDSNVLIESFEIVYEELSEMHGSFVTGAGDALGAMGIKAF